MSLTNYIADIKCVEGYILSQVAISMGEQLSKIESNKNPVANHFLNACAQSW